MDFDDERLDYTWITDRFAIGGAVWNRLNMRKLIQAGFTHIVDLQSHFNDLGIAEGLGIKALWCPIHDDFQDKPVEPFD